MNACCRYYNRTILLVREKQAKSQQQQQPQGEEEFYLEKKTVHKLDSLLDFLEETQLDGGEETQVNLNGKNYSLKPVNLVMGKELLVDELGYQIWYFGMIRFFQGLQQKDLLIHSIVESFHHCRNGQLQSGKSKIYSDLRSAILSFYLTAAADAQLIEVFEGALVNSSIQTYTLYCETCLREMTFQKYCQKLPFLLSLETDLLNYVYLEGGKFAQNKEPFFKGPIDKLILAFFTVTLKERESLFREALHDAFTKHDDAMLDLLIGLLTKFTYMNQLVDTQYESYLSLWIHKTLETKEALEIVLEEFLWNEGLLRRNMQATESMKKIFEKYFKIILTNNSNTLQEDGNKNSTFLKNVTLFKDIPYTFACQFHDLLVELSLFVLCETDPRKIHLASCIQIKLENYLKLFYYLEEKDLFMKDYGSFLSDRFLSYYRQVLMAFESRMVGEVFRLSLSELLNCLENGILVTEDKLISSFEAVCGYESSHKLRVMYEDFIKFLVKKQPRNINDSSAVSVWLYPCSSRANFLIGTVGAWPNSHFSADSSPKEESPSIAELVKEFPYLVQLQRILENYADLWQRLNPRKKLDFICDTFSLELSLDFSGFHWKPNERPHDAEILAFRHIITLKQVSWPVFHLLAYLLHHWTLDLDLRGSVDWKRTVFDLKKVNTTWTEGYLLNIVNTYNTIFKVNNGNLVFILPTVTFGNIVVHLDPMVSKYIEPAPAPTACHLDNITLSPDLSKTEKASGLDRQSLVEAFIVRFMKCAFSTVKNSQKEMHKTQNRGVSKVTLMSELCVGFKCFKPDPIFVDKCIESLLKKGFIDVLPESSQSAGFRYIYLP